MNQKSLINYPKDAYFASLEEAQKFLDQLYNEAEDKALLEKKDERIH